MQVLAIVSGLAQANGPYGYHMHDHGWAGMIFGPLAMLLFLALVVAAVVLALRWLGVAAPERSRPMQILEERFARGEIDAEDFALRRKALEH